LTVAARYTRHADWGVAWLSREQRLKRAGSGKVASEPTGRFTACLFRLARSPNGSPVCSDECHESWWRLVPTISGKLYVPRQWRCSL
jgi:hypothetical protein